MGTFRHDSRGIEMDKPAYTLPEKVWFDFKIMEADATKSKKGYDMVKLRAEVINSAEHNGKSLFHYVTFIPKGEPGDGISVHFRKCIGVAYGGDDVIDSDEWIGKRFKASTIIDEYEGKKSSKVKAVDSCEKFDDSDDIQF